MLADPVGSGKTYVALAVAAALGPGPVTCLAPATLLAQWRSVATALGIEIVVLSHQAVSRGQLPAGRRGPVLIDEAHGFRNAATRRYRHAAPWLRGRRVLLVTATPVVNRLADLLHQLLLCVRDDALAPDGVPSLRRLLGSGCGSPALGRLVIEGRLAEGLRPARLSAVSRASLAECRAAEDLLASLDRLQLSRVPGTAALVRTVLRRAAASSPAALSAALRRYRTLLLHARDAAGAGRRLERSAIRRFAGPLEDQLVWWELMPSDDDPNDLSLSDLDRLDEVIIGAARLEGDADGKIERLRAILRDGPPTLVFTSHRETVRYLRDRLAPMPLAWCTGIRAGLGHCALPRSTVLGWFRQGEADLAPPAVHHLLTTDVAAEGLDLQRAGRVVHYDLPWTPMRLEQREGRALRLGSLHRSVEAITMSPPPVLERALRVTRALAAKAGLPARAGLGTGGRGLWRWRSELADAYGDPAARPGTAAVGAEPGGALALFELYGAGPGPGIRLATALVWVEPGRPACEDEAVVAARLTAALASPAAAPSAERLREALTWLAAPVRERMVLARGSGWSVPQSDPVSRQVSRRLHRAIREAARSRDLESLAGLERALGFVGRGHTAGESLALERLARLPEVGFEREASRLPASGSRWETVEPRLVGLVLFVPDRSVAVAPAETGHLPGPR
jgi:hypothetical protein